MSARRKLIAWCSIIVLPKLRRSRAYASAASNAARATPIACAATLMRPDSRFASAMR